MNKKQLPKTVGYRIRFREPAVFRDGQKHDDEWLVLTVNSDDERIELRNLRTNGLVTLGFDHVQKYTSAPEQGPKSGFYTLDVHVLEQADGRFTADPIVRGGIGNAPRVRQSSRAGVRALSAGAVIIIIFAVIGTGVWWRSITETAERVAHVEPPPAPTPEPVESPPPEPAAGQPQTATPEPAKPPPPRPKAESQPREPQTPATTPEPVSTLSPTPSAVVTPEPSPPRVPEPVAENPSRAPTPVVIPPAPPTTQQPVQPPTLAQSCQALPNLISRGRSLDNVCRSTDCANEAAINDWTAEVRRYIAPFPVGVRVAFENPPQQYWLVHGFPASGPKLVMLHEINWRWQFLIRVVATSACSK